MHGIAGKNVLFDLLVIDRPGKIYNTGKRVPENGRLDEV
jgi:hypothetical protein